MYINILKYNMKKICSFNNCVRLLYRINNDSALYYKITDDNY